MNKISIFCRNDVFGIFLSLLRSGFRVFLLAFACLPCFSFLTARIQRSHTLLQSMLSDANFSSGQKKSFSTDALANMWCKFFFFHFIMHKCLFLWCFKAQWDFAAVVILLSFIRVGRLTFLSSKSHSKAILKEAKKSLLKME